MATFNTAEEVKAIERIHALLKAEAAKHDIKLELHEIKGTLVFIPMLPAPEDRDIGTFPYI
jgi:hypothetical protein